MNKSIWEGWAELMDKKKEGILCTMNDILCGIVYGTPKKEDKIRATNLLLKRRLDNKTLIELKIYAPLEEQRKEARRRLLAQNPNDEKFVYILIHPDASQEDKDWASKYLLARLTKKSLLDWTEVDTFILCLIVRLASSHYKGLAAKELLKRKEIVDNREFCIIICWAPLKCKAEAAEELLKKEGVSNDELGYVIFHAPEPLKARAWDRFLGQNPINSELRWIIGHAPKKYKRKAWKEFLSRNPDEFELRLVIDIPFIPEEYKDRARKKLRETKKHLNIHSGV